MTISATAIRKPRRRRRCCFCDRLIDGHVVRSYGYAHRGDKPYVVYQHVECARISRDLKALRAIEKAEAQDVK